MKNKPYDFSADYKTSDKTQCPHCGKFTDAAMGEEGTSPSEGCISICIGCAKPSVFNKDLTLRVLNEEEEKNPDLQRELAKLIPVVQRAIMSVHHKNAGSPPIIPLPRIAGWETLWSK